MSRAEPSDYQLLVRSSADPQAFVAFYRRYEAAIVGYFVRRVGDPEVAADLTAEVFAAVLRAAPRYRRSGPTAAAWLFTIAHNKLANAARRRQVDARARLRVGIREVVSFSDDQLERVEAVADDELWAAELLKRLPADQADAIRARVLDERRYDAIAAELRTSELVIRKRVSRGLATLRNELNKESLG